MLEELSNKDFNLLVYHRTEEVVLKYLGPKVAESFRAALGPNWGAELNRRRLEDRRGGSEIPAMRLNSGGDVIWDLSQLLYCIRENTRDLRGSFTGSFTSVVECCRRMRDQRNVISHVNVETIDLAAGDRKIIFYAEQAILLLEAFRLEQEAAAINSLVDAMLGRLGKKFTDTMAKAAHQDPSPTPNPTPAAPVAETSDTAEKDQPEKKRPSAMLSVSSQDVDQVFSRRRKPLPAPGNGVVYFPLIGGLPDEPAIELLASIKARLFRQDGGARSIAPGLDLLSDAFTQVVETVRSYEEDDAKTVLQTRHMFDPTYFVGPSFGLAAAFADRSARYGLHPDILGRPIVATGKVPPHGGGRVLAIDGLAEKIAVVIDAKLERPVFVFPKENFDRADPVTRGAIEKLGVCDIEWRAVAHVDELNDWLAAASKEVASKPDAPTLTPVTAPPTIEVDPVLTEQTRGEEAPPPTTVGRTSSWSFARLVAVTSLSGLSLLAAMYVGALVYEGSQEDPAVIQASDERLMALLRNASFATKSPSAMECIALTKAAGSLQPDDQKRLESQHKEALHRAAQCDAALSDSQKRLANLLTTYKAADTSRPEDLVRLASATSQVSAFDKGQNLSRDLQKALDAGNDATRLLSESDARLSGFAEAYNRWQLGQDNGQALDEALAKYRSLSDLDKKRATGAIAKLLADASKVPDLVDSSARRIDRAVVSVSSLEANDSGSARANTEAAIAALTSLDFSRMSGPQRSLIERGRDLPSKKRLNDVLAALSKYRADPSPQNTVALAASYRSLSSAERTRNASALSAGRSEISAAENSISESDIRLLGVLQAASGVVEARRKTRGLAPAYDAMEAQTAGLREIDRFRATADQMAAIEIGDEVASELKRSDRRILDATTWANMAITAAAAGKPASPEIMQNVRLTRGALSQLDRERLTSSQERVLEKACGVPVKSTPGMVAALPGSDCIAGSVRTPQLLQPIYPVSQ